MERNGHKPEDEISVEHQKANGTAVDPEFGENPQLEDLFAFYLNEIGSQEVSPKNNPENTKKVRKAQFSLRALSTLAGRQFLSHKQRGSVEDILDGFKVANMVEGFNSVVNQKGIAEGIATERHKAFLKKVRSFDRKIRSDINGFEAMSGKNRQKSVKRFVTNEEEAIRIGLVAYDDLIRSNLKLVVGRAKKFYKVGGLPLSHLSSFGVDGLIRAVVRFDPDLGWQFSTYATTWIDQAIQRGISEGGTMIRLPVHSREWQNVAQKKIDNAVQLVGRDLTHSELREVLGGEENWKRFYLNQTVNVASLDKKVKLEDFSEVGLEEVIVDTESMDVEDQAIRNIIHETIPLIFEELRERESEALKLRFGVEDGRSRTLDEVGIKLGTTREGARQIQNRALEKIRRNPGLVRKLKPLWEALT